MATPPPATLGAEVNPLIETINNVTKMNSIEIDPMDLPAAILYLVFNLILTVTPVTIFYTVVEPIISQWASGYNNMYKVSWYIMWIGNLVIYALPTVIGGFTWMWNVYVVGGYLAWTQYLIVWGGTIMQFINFILLILGASLYSEVSTTGAGDTMATAWIEFAVWLVVTAGTYVGFWLLNDNFLAYYVIEEIINGLSPSGDADPEQLATFVEVLNNATNDNAGAAVVATQ